MVSCTHHGKIPAEKFRFLCFADKIGLVFSFLVFYLFGYLFVQAFPVQVKPVRATPAQEKLFLGKKAPKMGDLGRYMAGRASVLTRRERAQARAILAVTGAVCGAAAALYLRTTSCRRVKLIYWFVGLFTCVNPVI